MKRILKVLWHLIAGVAVLSGIYQGFVAYKVPRADLSLVQQTTSFEMHRELDPVFDQLEEDERLELARRQAYLAKYSSIKSITFAGLHNAGEKIATDIRVTFPNARLISVRADGDKGQVLKGQTQVTVDKLLPSAAVYFVVWGGQEDRSDVEQSISAVHSEGIVEITQLSSSRSSGQAVNEVLQPLLFVLMGILLACMAYLGYQLWPRGTTDPAK